MARRQRWRLSPLRVIVPTLLAAITLSWLGAMMGLFQTNDTLFSTTSSKISKKQIEEAMMLPDNFYDSRPALNSKTQKKDVGHDGNAKVASAPTQSPPIGRVRHKQHNGHYPRTISPNGDKTNYEPHTKDQNDDEAEPTKRKIKVSKRSIKEQKRLLNSNDFSYRDPLYDGDCVPMQPWQETSFPNCNMMHELDFSGKARVNEFSYFTSGGYNDIFRLREANIKGTRNDPELAMKILEYGTDYTDRNFDRVRRDGLILERLTKSPHVLNTYGFCGFDVLVPYADGGTFSSLIRQWRKGKLELSSTDRLRYAVEVAQGLADVHDIDGEGMSSVAHGDLKGQQYLISDGKLLLGDFNRGRFIRRNSTQPDAACTYTIGKNDHTFRSPQEYQYVPQTSAIDVWALGSILYTILTGSEPWDDVDTKKAQKRIAKGELPKFDEAILQSQDPVEIILKKAIDMCYVYDPTERSTAKEVTTYLEQALDSLAQQTLDSIPKSSLKKLKRRSINGDDNDVYDNNDDI